MKANKFKEDYTLENCVYNIDLYFNLLNKLSDYLCPILTESDFKYVMNNFKNVNEHSDLLSQNEIQKYFLVLFQLQEKNKLLLFIDDVKENSKHLQQNWSEYYNKDIFEKAKRDYLFWNESKLKNIIHQVDGEISLINNFITAYENKYLNKKTKQSDITKEQWFVVGVEFAKGTIQDLNKKGYSGSEIAEKLFNNKNYRVYINESLGVSNGNKNLFKNIGKLKDIINYCNSHKIKICDDFLEKYQVLKNKII